MKVLITGTHFTPAVAVIEKLIKEKDISIVYVGRSNTMEWDFSPSVESSILPQMGVDFVPIISGRLARAFSLVSLISLFKIPLGFVHSFFVLLKQKPDVVVSFGGYTAVPVVITAWLFSIPILIHEQGLKLGLANKISSFFADKIALSFDSPQISGGKYLLTGNPLREEITNPSKNNGSPISKFINNARKKNKSIVLITGGNQGSHIINLAVEKIIAQLAKVTCIIHITGHSKYQDYDRLKMKEDENYTVYKWVDKEFGYILKKTDLVITRAGMNTLMEIGFFKKPTIIIPIPNKEQTENADYFSDKNGAMIISQKELNPDFLLGKIKECLGHNKNSIYQDTKTDMNEAAASRLVLEILLLGHL